MQEAKNTRVNLCAQVHDEFFLRMVAGWRKGRNRGMAWCGVGACAIGMPRDSGRVTREGDDFQFYSTNANGRVPSGNFESNWLSDHRLRKQMSVDFVARHR